MRFGITIGLTILAFGLAAKPASAVTCGQIDDFQALSVSGWVEGFGSPNPPTVVSDGGPGGVGDHALENSSSGGFGPGSKMIMFNAAQWTGDYTALNLPEVRIEARMANTGATALSMRIALQGAFGQRYATTTGAALPADGQWHQVSFGLTASDLSLIGGSASLATVLGNVSEMRINSASAPAWTGDSLVGTLRMDNLVIRVPGDVNGDGIVDIGDLALIGGQWATAGAGSSGSLGNGDISGDGDGVDIGDLAVVGGNWNLSGTVSLGGSGASAVPAPPAAAVGAIGLAGLAARRRS
ncbi:MAG: hypothetical protein CMJ49_12230 [Planctomycetaceae bacterium]|nr:hypothetical protein [Planctomycetaceae bacterium]